MPNDTPTPKPVQGWFIPAQPTVPAEPKMPLLTRLTLACTAIPAIATTAGR